MDRGLKERLVGAAVLVAIGAWLIPWVLDGPEEISQPAATALELPVPSAENPPVRTETVVLDRRESPVADPSPTAPASSTAATSRDDFGTADSSRLSSSPAPVAKPASVPAAPAASSEPEWYVQIGAFGDQDNAQRQAARVGTFGFDAHVSAFPGGGGIVHRVRVGPQSTRERAEAIVSSLSAHGFVAQVTFE